MAALTEPQTRRLDALVRLSLEEDGLLAIVESLRDQAMKQVFLASGHDIPIAVGYAKAYEHFLSLLLSLPVRIEALDVAAKARSTARA